MENYIPDLPLDPPEPRDYEREEEVFWMRSDMEYESMREDEILNG